MKIKVDYRQLFKVVNFIKQHSLRHGPFRKTGAGYEIYLYPNKKLTLLLLTDSSINVIE
jgi:hypothetical protein